MALSYVEGIQVKLEIEWQRLFVVISMEVISTQKIILSAPTRNQKTCRRTNRVIAKDMKVEIALSIWSMATQSLSPCNVAQFRTNWPMIFVSTKL